MRNLSVSRFAGALQHFRIPHVWEQTDVIASAALPIARTLSACERSAHRLLHGRAGPSSVAWCNLDGYTSAPSAPVLAILASLAF